MVDDSHSPLYLDINIHNTDSTPIVPLYDKKLLLLQKQIPYLWNSYSGKWLVYRVYAFDQCAQWG